MNNSKIPIMKKHQLSYLIGMFLGDGCVYINNKNKKHPIYQFSITGEDYDILEICHDIIKKRFNKTGKIKEIYKNGKFSYFQLLVCSKKICYFFKGLTKSRTRIPFIKKEDVMSRKYLCSGLMDSDGWVSIVNASDGYLRYRVGFKNTYPFVLDFYNILNDLNIKTGKIQKKTVPSRVYKNKMGKESLSFSINTESFYYNLFFLCERKQDKMELYKKNILNGKGKR